MNPTSDNSCLVLHISDYLILPPASFNGWISLREEVQSEAAAKMLL